MKHVLSFKVGGWSCFTFRWVQCFVSSASCIAVLVLLWCVIYNIARTLLHTVGVNPCLFDFLQSVSVRFVPHHRRGIVSALWHHKAKLSTGTISCENLIHADHCAFFFFFLGKGGNVEVCGESCREVWVFPPYSLGMGSFHLITGHRCLYLASHCWDNPSIAPHHTWVLDGWMMLDRDLQTSNNWNMLDINFQPTLWHRWF